jgi:hypothetical protein
MSVSPQKRRGDPAFEGSDAVTHAPVIEEERFASSPGLAPLKRPFPWVMVAIAAGLAGVAVIAGAAAGWSYTVPFAVLAVLVLGFALTSWRLARRADREG